MNRTFDYNGVQIAPSRPIQKLRTVKKTIYIDSADRDIVKYPRNGDFVVYLPRAYEKVVSINLKSAEFPLVNAGVTSVQTYDIATKANANLSTAPLYFLVELEGLNKSDETSVAANRSASTDSVFAKIQVPDTTNRIIYSDNTGPQMCQYYQPALGKLDRLHVRTRLHSQTQNQYMYWTSDFGLTLEIETLENSFDDFSAIETRIGERSDGTGFYGC